jgi:hypothetical protein
MISPPFYGPLNPHFGQIKTTLCSLQLEHRPIMTSQVGHWNVAEPCSSKPFPQEMHRSAFFIGTTVYTPHF